MLERRGMRLAIVPGPPLQLPYRDNGSKMRDLATRLDPAQTPKQEDQRVPLQSNPRHGEPTCDILALRLIPRLCCAVPGAVPDLNSRLQFPP